MRAPLWAEVDGSRISWMLKARVLIPTTLAVAAVLLGWWFRLRLASDGMDAVVDASAGLEYRPSLARLSGDFPYREVKPRLRGGDANSGSSALWTLIERLRDDGRDPQALGVSYLLVGRPKDAVVTLERTLRSTTNHRGDLAEAIRRSRDAALLNDLAVTYFALEDPSLQSLALEAVQRAWSIDKTPAIAWTRAVVIESYHVRERSAAAWRDYLALDARSQWSAVAHQRLNGLLQPTDAELWPAARARLLAARDDDPALLRDVDQFRQQVRLWCEDELLPRWAGAFLRNDPSAASLLTKVQTLASALIKVNSDREVADAVNAILAADGNALRQIATGHAAYGAAMRSERDSKTADAVAHMATAAAVLTPRTTPFGWRARMEYAGMLYSSSEYEQALRKLQDLDEECRAQLSTAGAARLETLLAVTFANLSSYKDAADHYTRALEAYRRIGERDYESALLVRLADALVRMGDTARARRHLQEGLEIQQRTGDPKHGHYAMVVAALHALEADQRAQAALFLDAVVDIDSTTGDMSRTCTSAMWRSAFRYRSGLTAAAGSELAVAQRACSSIADRTTRERQLAYLAVAKAFGADRSSAEPLTDLDEAIRYFDRSNNRIWLSTAYLARARRLADRGEAAAAESDFRAALREIDVNREKINARLLRISFTATSDEIADGYVAFLLQQGRDREAFETSDGRRVRELIDSPTARWRGDATLPDIQRALPARTALVEYRVLRDRIVAWVVTPQRFETRLLPVSVGDITAVAGDVESNASFLHDALIRPMEVSIPDAHGLVIVPDDELERIPFSALSDGTRPLCETRPTVVAPSAALFVRSRDRWLERSTTNEQVVVVEAAAGGEELAYLPEAKRETESIARLYRGAQVIANSAVTPESLLKKVKEASILHFAGHAVTGDASAQTLRLGEAPQTRLGLADIAGAELPRMRLVYLSACETDNGPVFKSEGSITLARSFFAAGVPLVVATLWPIDDGAAHLAARTFHRHSLRGDTPAEALRQAQLALIREGHQFRDWASLRLIGAGF